MTIALGVISMAFLLASLNQMMLRHPNPNEPVNKDVPKWHVVLCFSLFVLFVLLAGLWNEFIDK